MHKTVTLVAEDHRDSTHAQKVMDLLEDALKTGDKVLLALEEPPAEGMETFVISKNGVDAKNKTQRTLAKSNVDNEIESKFGGLIIKTKNQYVDRLQKLQKRLKDNQEIVVACVDAPSADATKQAEAESPKRDKIMKERIDNLCTARKIEQVIYPVGAAHIFDASDKGKARGNRLGSLCQNDPEITLKVKNCYDKSKKIGKEIEDDHITKFHQYHKSNPVQKALPQPKVKPSVQSKTLTSSVSKKRPSSTQGPTQQKQLAKIQRTLTHHGVKNTNQSPQNLSGVSPSTTPLSKNTQNTGHGGP